MLEFFSSNGIIEYDITNENRWDCNKKIIRIWIADQIHSPLKKLELEL